VAFASGKSDFSKSSWTNLSTDKPMLQPELPWERDCIEGASVIERKGKLYMFYAGAYNNAPQQVGVAVSVDGKNWKRLSDKPFLKNGKDGEWNSSESGHPHIFKDDDGRTYLFFQGNNDKGKTWFISKIEVKWDKKGPYIQ
jgi:beta-xylosidase